MALPVDMTEEQFFRIRDDIYSNQFKRLSHLYHVINKDGNLVVFKPNWAQMLFLKGMHFNNIILKCRQLGFSTFIGIYMLDQALFVPNTAGGIIAHTKDDATKLFRRIKLAYENMDQGFRDVVKLDGDSATELRFSNGSSIVVDTSMRSATVQLLHISEFGPICAHYPEKALEIMTGSLEAVGKGQLVFIESTAEGSGGHFFDMWNTAIALQKAGEKLTIMDYKPFFFPWHQEPSYVLHEYVEPNKQMKEYFRKLESIGIKLSGAQQAWYIKKHANLTDKMWQEYPSTPEEAFQGSKEGIVYGRQITDARIEKRIGRVPYDKNALVHTAWDLGGATKSADYSAVIFFQICGNEIHIIDFYQSDRLSLPENIHMVKKKPYNFGDHIAPHDINVTEMSTGYSRLEVSRRLGFKFFVVGKNQKGEKVSLIEGIDATRGIFPRLWIDEDKCKDLISCIDNYAYEWDERLVRWSDKPKHNWASHGCDALRYMAIGLNRVEGGSKTLDNDLKALKAYWGG